MDLNNQKMRSVWLQKNKNSCMNIVPNTCACEQQEQNNTKRQNQKANRNECAERKQSWQESKKAFPQKMKKIKELIERQEI